MGLDPRLGYHVIPTAEQLRAGILEHIRQEHPEYRELDDEGLWALLVGMFERQEGDQQ